MKLRKLVSFITTLAIASTMFVALSNVVSAATEPTLNVYTINVEENAALYTDIDEKEGYDRYLVYYTLDGFDLTNDAFQAITIAWNISDASKVEPSSFKLPSSRPAAKNGVYKTWDATVVPFMFEQDALNFTKSGGDGYFPYPSTVTDYANPGETYPLIYTIWYVAEGESIDITYRKSTGSETMIALCPFDDASTVSAEYYGDNLKMNVAKITLGTAAPEPTTPVITGTDAASEVITLPANDEGEVWNGKVWNNVKIENVSKGINYKVTFTDGTKSVTRELNLNNKEVNDDISFALIVKSLKTGLANLTMSIGYTDAPAE